MSRLALGAALGLALATARERRRLAADRRRFALIRDAALIADTELSVEEVLERLHALLVPAFADACTIDLGRAEPHAFSVRAMVVPLRSRGRDIGTMRVARDRAY